jgi:streptogramin lyase
MRIISSSIEGLPAGLAAGATVAVLALAPLVVLDRMDAPGPQPEGLASDGTHLWVADFQTGLLYEIDTASKTVVRTFDAPGPRPEGLAWDGSRLWCADWEDKKIYLLSVSDTVLVAEREFPSPMGSRPVGLAWDGEALWLTTWSPFYLFRLDPVTGDTLRSRLLYPAEPLYPTLTPQPEDLAWDGTHLWLTDWGTRQIYRVDPDSLVVTETHRSGGPASVGLAFHQGYMWNGDTGERSVTPALYQLDIRGPVRVVERVTWGGLKRSYVEP